MVRRYAEGTCLHGIQADYRHSATFPGKQFWAKPCKHARLQVKPTSDRSFQIRVFTSALMDREVRVAFHQAACFLRPRISSSDYNQTHGYRLKPPVTAISHTFLVGVRPDVEDVQNVGLLFCLILQL